jgi:uncharacterized membrane protein
MGRRYAAALVDASSIFGALVLVSGGLWLRNHGRFPGFDIDLTWYGPYFAPLALCLMTGWRPGGYVLGWVDRAAVRFDALSRGVARRWVLLAVGLVIAAHSGAVYLRYMSFQAGMDLAIYANACRNGLFSTMKGDVWLLADHFEPLLGAFVPLCRRFDPALVLLFAQELSFGIGALGLYALAVRRDWRKSQAATLALLYLGFLGNVIIAYYDFHLLALALGIVPWLWWAIESEHYAGAALIGMLYIGLKESVPLSIVGLGGYLLLVGPGRRRWLGVFFLIAGAGSFVLIMKVVYPLFRHGEETMYFAKYYGHLGANMGEFVRTIVTRPLYFLSTLTTRLKIEYVIAIFAPFLFLPVFRPQYWLPIAPAIFVNIASNDNNLLGRAYHYEAEIYPVLFALAVVAFRSVRLRAAWLAVLVILFSAASPLAAIRRNRPTAFQHRLQAQLSRHVPSDVAVAAPQRLAAHLTSIPRLYMFDYWHMEEDWKRADVVVVGYPGDRLGWYAWSVLQYLTLPRMLPMLRPLYRDPNDPNFRVYEVLRPQPALTRNAPTPPGSAPGSAAM